MELYKLLRRNAEEGEAGRNKESRQTDRKRYKGTVNKSVHFSGRALLLITAVCPVLLYLLTLCVISLSTPVYMWCKD